MPELSDRELATVLAALRYWQQDLVMNEGEPPISPHFEGGVTPLAAGEIDDLCERLNPHFSPAPLFYAVQ